MNVEFLGDAFEGEPLVRIYGTANVEFSFFHREILKLSNASALSCSIDKIPGFCSVAGCGLTAVSSSQDLGVEQREGNLSFVWALTPARWSIAAGLIEPFLHNGGGHQWLAGSEARYGLEVGSILILISHSKDGCW